MRWAEARTELQSELVPRLEEPITATAAGQKFTIDPQRAGLTFNLDATLRAGLGGEPWDPRHMLRVVMGGSALPLVIDVDDAELDAALERIAGKVEKDPTDATVEFAVRRAQVTPGVEGLALNFTDAAEALKQALVDGDTTVEFFVDGVKPDVTTTEATDFSEHRAARALSGAVRIRIAGAVRTLRPVRFAPALRADVEDGRLTLGIDPGALMARNRDLLAALPHHPVDAKIMFSNGHPTVVPSRSGVSVAPADLAAAVLKAVAQTGRDRIATTTVTPDLPPFTTREAQALKLEQVVAASEVRLPGSSIEEIQALANRLDGAIVRPQATFSLLARIGVGGATDAGPVASALFDAAFRAGLGSIDRSSPRLLTPGAEPGLDAFVDQGVDLAWTNTTPYGVFVHAVVDESGPGPAMVRVQLWGSHYWNVDVSSSGRYNVVQPHVRRVSAPGCTPIAGRAGFEVDVSRTITRAGEGSRTESVHSAYQVTDRVICTRR